MGRPRGLHHVGYCAAGSERGVPRDARHKPDHGDIAKSVRFGAAMVMISSLVAGHEESPGRTMEVDGKRYK